MELSKWETLERIFILLRFDIQNENNEQIAEVIIHSLNNNFSNSDLCEQISNLLPKWKNQFPLNNTNDITLQKETKVYCSSEIQLFIIKALELMKSSLSARHYDIAYDIADFLQGLYGVILTNSRKSYKQYWKTYIKPFQKKWNLNTFQFFKAAFQKQHKKCNQRLC